jgi:hypothetical protein
MQDNPEQYPGLEVYLAAYYNDGFVGNYVKNDKVPQIIQYRLTAENLRRVITDITEADRIEQEVQAGWQYPLMSLPNPRACQDYARYIGKRLPRDNAESNQLLEALPWYANGEKLTNAGIPIPGIFDADTVHVVSDGRWTNWVTTDRYGSGFVALWLGRFFRVAHDRRIDFNGSSPILLEDIVPA